MLFIATPTDALWPPDIICTVTKSPITRVITKMVPMAMPGLHSGRITCQTVRHVPAPASYAASMTDGSMRIIELKIGTTMNSV